LSLFVFTYAPYANEFNRCLTNGIGANLQTKAFEGEIDYTQVMDESGKIDASLFPKGLDDAKILDMYKWMSFARALDTKTLSLQRQGRAITYAPLVGEEATQIGSAMAMRPGDIFVPNFRQHGVFLVRGLPLDLYFIYWRGFEEGGNVPKEVGGFPVCIPVASQLPHAAGAAFAQKYNKTGNAIIAYVGDGGTSEGKKNLMYDPSDQYAELSQTGRYAIGGLLNHARALSAIVSPTVNSYRRLIPGFEAPVYLAWSKANRSAVVRVPAYHKGVEKAKRIEYRAPDGSSNPYLAFSAMLSAALDGITKKIEPINAVEENIYHIDSKKREELGIREIPRSLNEALDELEGDREFLKPIFNDSMLDQYIDLKRNEARTMAMYPHPMEMYYYLDA